jgi:diaminohydroxyphosphoribosylaminopyrimidine deaminase/5-amino-6-(5-phosphoribosylamino)uracil reductase
MKESKKNLFFSRTLELAKLGWGTTHPNPMVGALIVEDGEIVAEGAHHFAGGPHAEIEALKNLGRNPAPGASMFVSLEPCSTSGRTPPCTRAISEAGISKVYVATLDPNPLHSGKGLYLLENANIKTELPDERMQKAATRLNFIFNHNMKQSTPLVALKFAESANGMVAEVAGKPSRVTENLARTNLMEWRRLFPAIGVGAGTVLSDDPSLTSRTARENFCPVRLVFDSTLSTFRDSISDRKIYSDEFVKKTQVITTSRGVGNSELLNRANRMGVSIIETSSQKDGRICPRSIPGILGKLNLNALYCEGGPTFAKSLLDAGMVDYYFRYTSPKVFTENQALPAPILKKFALGDPITEKFGEDQLTHGFL